MEEDRFGKRDYWQPPEEFELRRMGACDDLALWTWRQFVAMGSAARLVFGRAERYGTGHAWVEFFRDGKCFLVEVTARSYRPQFPRLSRLGYESKLSVSWDGEKLSYYQLQADS